VYNFQRGGLAASSFSHSHWCRTGAWNVKFPKTVLLTVMINSERTQQICDILWTRQLYFFWISTDDCIYWNYVAKVIQITDTDWPLWEKWQHDFHLLNGEEIHSVLDESFMKKEKYIKKGPTKLCTKDFNENSLCLREPGNKKRIFFPNNVFFSFFHSFFLFLFSFLMYFFVCLFIFLCFFFSFFFIFSFFSFFFFFLSSYFLSFFVFLLFVGWFVCFFLSFSS